MKDTNMAIKTTYYPGISRRTVLGAIVAGAGLSSLPWSIRTALAEAAAGSAIAFDGDALIVARGTLSRNDGGGTWTSLPAPVGGGIGALATHPARPGRIAAGLTSGGVALSEDGGRSWQMRGQGLPGAGVTAITLAAGNPDSLYAAVRGDGLWQSDDAGRSWTFAMDRPWLADAEHDLTALASVDLATGMGGIWIYAGTEAGLTRVPDCFCRWQDVQPGNAMDALVSGTPPSPEAPLPKGEPINALASAASRPTRLYAALPSGVWESQDAGVVWSQRTSDRAVAVAVHPVNSDHVIAITGDGLIQSSDGGMTWTVFAHS
jgi:hypothetical protein